jgi:alpha-ketoglutarate-dependent taurine dioxygenase
MGTSAGGLDLEPVTGALGCVVRGVDLRAPLEPESVVAVRRAVLDHGVVFFRDQDLSRDEMLAFMSSFGTPCNDPFAVERAVAPEDTVIEMPTLPNKRATALWHTDSSLAPEPASLIALRAVEIPPVGGDTCFSNMYAAYDALSEPLRRLLDGLSAVHSAVKVLPLLGGTYGRLQEDLRSVHPVVRVHPETGRRALFVNELWTEHIVELRPNESAALLGLLYEHVKAPELALRWRWRVNDVAFWDNRAYQHYAVNDYDQRRVLQKSLLAGDRPYGPRDAPRHETAA